MRLHENKKIFAEVIRATAQNKGLAEIFVEKDYWVTLALKLIFSSRYAEVSVFKGGTALSKCFDFIERFSEDVDIVAIREGGESDNQMKTKIKKIENVVSEKLPEVEIEGVTQKRGMNRKTAHEYPSLFEKDFQGIRNFIVLEISWFGSAEPFLKKEISTYAYDFLKLKNENEIIEKFDLHPFEVRTLDPRRTLCEKIMSMVRFSYSEYPIESLKQKIRHLYDLNRLLENELLKEFFNSEEFDQMMKKVAREDYLSFTDRGNWITKPPAEALIFKEPSKVWKELQQTYRREFERLVYGMLPEEKEILQTLNMLKTRLREIEWKLDVD